PPTAVRQTAELFASIGQAADVPVHCSATSQMPAEPRQTVEDATKVLAGHAAEVPVQLSVTSHEPAAMRQAVEEDTNELEGQVFEVPVQLSTASHEPTAARQTAEVGWNNVPLGHVPLVPLHFSSASPRVVGFCQAVVVRG